MKPQQPVDKPVSESGSALAARVPLPTTPKLGKAEGSHHSWKQRPVPFMNRNLP